MKLNDHKCLLALCVPSGVDRIPLTSQKTSVIQHNHVKTRQTEGRPAFPLSKICFTSTSLRVIHVLSILTRWDKGCVRNTGLFSWLVSYNASAEFSIQRDTSGTMHEWNSDAEQQSGMTKLVAVVKLSPTIHCIDPTASGSHVPLAGKRVLAQVYIIATTRDKECFLRDVPSLSGWPSEMFFCIINCEPISYCCKRLQLRKVVLAERGILFLEVDINQNR